MTFYWWFAENKLYAHEVFDFWPGRVHSWVYSFTRDIYLLPQELLPRIHYILTVILYSSHQPSNLYPYPLISTLTLSLLYVTLYSYILPLTVPLYPYPPSSPLPSTNSITHYPCPLRSTQIHHPPPSTPTVKWRKSILWPRTHKSYGQQIFSCR